MNKKIIILIIIAIVIGVFFFFDLQQYLSLSALNQHQEKLQNWYTENPVLMLSIFFVIYLVATAFSLPGAVILTLAAGALFGLILGTILVSFASTLGATGAFLFSRFLFRSTIKKRFSKQMQIIDKGLEKEGAFYLFSLRLVPLFPFFMINIVMGVTSIRTVTFYWVSQLGMFIGTAVYVNAGTQISQIRHLSDILSPPLILSLVMLGLLPLVAKKIIEFIKYKKISSLKIFNKSL